MVTQGEAVRTLRGAGGRRATPAPPRERRHMGISTRACTVQPSFHGLSVEGQFVGGSLLSTQTINMSPEEEDVADEPPSPISSVNMVRAPRTPQGCGAGVADCQDVMDVARILSLADLLSCSVGGCRQQLDARRAGDYHACPPPPLSHHWLNDMSSGAAGLHTHTQTHTHTCRRASEVPHQTDT